MAAFQAYGGDLELDDATYRWSCYATHRVYEIRTLNPDLPQPPQGRKWVTRRQHGQSGDPMAIMVDDATTEFSHMLAQVSRPVRAD